FNHSHFSFSRNLTSFSVFLNSPATPIMVNPWSLYSSYRGTIVLLLAIQGPHQVAHKFNKATFPLILSESLTTFPFKSGAEKSWYFFPTFIFSIAFIKLKAKSL